MTSLLLDTHALIWWVLDPRRLPQRSIDAISDAEQVFVSPLSLWEIVIKESTLRPILGLPDVHHWFTESLATSGFSSLPIELRHIAAVQHLPIHHRDPFDRLLVAQARMEGLTLVSKDRKLAKYDVAVIWDGTAEAEER